jgi:hypothetical protein
MASCGWWTKSTRRPDLPAPAVIPRFNHSVRRAGKVRHRRRAACSSTGPGRSASTSLRPEPDGRPIGGRRAALKPGRHLYGRVLWKMPLSWSGGFQSPARRYFRGAEDAADQGKILAQPISGHFRSPPPKFGPNREGIRPVGPGAVPETAATRGLPSARPSRSSWPPSYRGHGERGHPAGRQPLGPLWAYTTGHVNGRNLSFFAERIHLRVVEQGVDTRSIYVSTTPQVNEEGACQRLLRFVAGRGTTPSGRSGGPVVRRGSRDAE